MDILFKNVTAVTMQKDNPVIYNANVGVANGCIAYVGKEDKTASRIIDGSNKTLMPGLYNCHTHTAMSLLRGFANDLALEEWLFQHIFPAEKKVKEIPGAVRIGALLAIAEMVASGTIAFSDMYFHLDAIAQAADESGVKVNLSNAVLAFDDSYDFYKDPCYAETLNILENYHNATHGRIKAEASLHCAYTANETAYRQVTEFALKHKINMHVHLSETVAEHNNCIEQHNLTPAQVFEKYGVYGVSTTSAHAVWVTEEDIDILARNNVTVAHNPVSNLKLASGIAPIKRMLEKGVNVALGTDGMASNNTHDLFEEIKLASILQKCASNDPTALPAWQVLEMATVNGAKAQGRQGGMIVEGLEADLVLLDFNNLQQTPCYDPLLNLAYSTTGRDVAMTLCQGRVLYENGEHKTIDVEKIKHEARKIAEAICK